MTPETREELARAIAMTLPKYMFDCGISGDFSKSVIATLAPIIERLVAERVAAETERCAGIAMTPGFAQARDTEWDIGFNDAKRTIAAAIRSATRCPM